MPKEDTQRATQEADPGEPEKEPVEPVKGPVEPVKVVDERVDPPPPPGPVPPRAPAADVITPPVRTKFVDPDYSARAKAFKLEGDVLLRAVVGPDGRVRDVTVLRPVHPLLDEAARKAVLQYEYEPGLRNGVPESVTMQITVAFTLR